MQPRPERYWRVCWETISGAMPSGVIKLVAGFILLTGRLKVCLVELQAKGAHPPGLLGCYGRVMWLQGNP